MSFLFIFWEKKLVQNKVLYENKNTQNELKREWKVPGCIRSHIIKIWKITSWMWSDVNVVSNWIAGEYLDEHSGVLIDTDYEAVVKLLREKQIKQEVPLQLKRSWSR